MIKKKFAKHVLGLTDLGIEKFRLMLNEDLRLAKIPADPKLNALLLSHSLEKGMSLNAPRDRFGEEKVRELLNILENLETGFEYNVSMSILQEFFSTHKHKDSVFGELEKTFMQIRERHAFQELPAGVDYVGREALLEQLKIDFAGFARSRHDIRKTTSQTIRRRDIENAIRIASSAPSACNRQPVKVYYSLDKEKSQRLGEIVSGNKSFCRDMANYCAIVVDNSYFASRPDEFRQSYLNAGIFLTYFTLALHSLSIGSCIMQFTGLVENADQRSRRLLKLRENEQVVAVVGYGYYPKVIKYSKAARRDINELGKEF